ncbi:MAG: late competence development ComFB family protein [Oscillospiraceae bacterium]|nr:late competence development ComFB family protein [Oscillospiraceae bacterium]
MALYKNVMEDLVEEQFDKIQKTLQCCTCEYCRSDIIAHALNHLPGKYVVTPRGEIYSKTYALGLQHGTDITAALTAAANVVREHPRHPKSE